MPGFICMNLHKMPGIGKLIKTENILVIERVREVGKIGMTAKGYRVSLS